MIISYFVGKKIQHNIKNNALHFWKLVFVGICYNSSPFVAYLSVYLLHSKPKTLLLKSNLIKVFWDNFLFRKQTLHSRPITVLIIFCIVFKYTKYIKTEVDLKFTLYFLVQNCLNSSHFLLNPTKIWQICNIPLF